MAQPGETEQQNLDRVIEQISERLELQAEKSGVRIDYSELVERLQEYAFHPLNLNIATREDLEVLLFLSQKQIYHLLAYRTNHGALLTIYELRFIEGFDRETISLILPFVTVEPVSRDAFKLRYLLERANHETMIRYKRSFGSGVMEKYKNSYGDPSKMLFRYRYSSSSKLDISFTFEKDAGEMWLTGFLPDSVRKQMPRPGYGPDFSSGSLMIHDAGILKKFVLGDYQVRFGQGLTLWSGLAFGPSDDRVEMYRYGKGLDMYTSTDENRFFRGSGAALQWGNISATGFYSDNRNDAGTTASNEDIPDEAILSESGIHGTWNELMKKDVLGIKSAGLLLKWQVERGHIGVAGVQHRFGQPVTTSDPFRYPWKAFGKENNVAGIEGSLLTGNVLWYGEAATSFPGNAWLFGADAWLNPRVTFAFQVRDYQPGYRNIASNAWARYDNANEQGLYTALSILPAAGWKVSATVDIYTVPWIRYRTNWPSEGAGSSFYVGYEGSGEWRAAMRLRKKSYTAQDVSAESWLQKLVRTDEVLWRIQCFVPVGEEFSWSSRLELKWLEVGESEHAKGSLMYQDFKWTPHKKNASITGRLMIFNTTGYESGIYCYEPDVYRSFSIPAYWGKGVRAIIMAVVRPSEKITFWLRVADTFTHDEPRPEWLPAGRKEPATELTLQLRVKI
ncbi:MAG: hypothetical protein Kow00127_05640 [Bacteroidales bacterium]